MTAADLTYTTTDTGYTILRDGVPWIVQNGFIPPDYKGATMAETAQNHINAILADQAKQQQAATDIETLKQQVGYMQASQLAMQAYIAQGGGTV